MMEFDEVGSVVVMTEDNGIAGIVTDRDVVVRGLAHECGPLTRVETIMSTPVITVHERQGAFGREDGARGVVGGFRVVNATGRLRGVVSLDDIMPLFTRSAERLARGAGQPWEATVLG